MDTPDIMTAEQRKVFNESVVSTSTVDSKSGNKRK